MGRQTFHTRSDWTFRDPPADAPLSTPDGHGVVRPRRRVRSGTVPPPTLPASIGSVPVPYAGPGIWLAWTAACAEALAADYAGLHAARELGDVAAPVRAGLHAEIHGLRCAIEIVLAALVPGIWRVGSRHDFPGQRQPEDGLATQVTWANDLARDARAAAAMLPGMLPPGDPAITEARLLAHAACWTGRSIIARSRPRLYGDHGVVPALIQSPWLPGTWLLALAGPADEPDPAAAARVVPIRAAIAAQVA